MKLFLTTITTLLIFSGCTTKNAFTSLQLQKEQEKAIENTRSWKLTSKGKVGGVFSVVYLNNIYKDIDPQAHVFYLSLYIKEESKDLQLTLNGRSALEIKELATTNKFSHLLPISNSWIQNMTVSFEKKEDKELILQIDSDQFSSDSLNFLKDL